MAGFTLQRKEIALRFGEDTDLYGFEVIAKLDVPLSLFLEFQASVISAPEEEPDLSGAFTLFSEQILISWNLEDEDGEPVPPTRDGFFNLPPRVASQIMEAWSSQVSEPDPLPDTTSSNSLPSEKDKEELMVLSPESPSNSVTQS